MDTPSLGEERGYVGLLHPRAERAGNDLPTKTTASPDLSNEIGSS